MAARSNYIPANIKGHRHFGYGGDVIPENVSITEYYDLTSLKKSKLRRNDELVPSPPEIDVIEKVIKVPVPREHPYASHIPRCAVFPYSRSSDNANHNAVKLLNKTIGTSCHQELLLKHTEPMVWPGQQGFNDYPKQMTGPRQEFYPAPPKIMCPNPSLSARETALSAQNFKMFQNWEQSTYCTTYQRKYPGIQPLTFDEKTTDISKKQGTPRTERQLPPVATGHATEMGPGPGLSLGELQDSYSRSDTLRDFHKSTNEAMVDLRDHMRTGKRFHFQGMCSHYFRNTTAVPLPVA